MKLFLRSHLQVHHSVSAVESSPDSLISVNKALKLSIQVLVLALEEVDVLLQSFDFSSQVVVALAHG